MTASILILDDEKNIRRTLRMVLEGERHVVHEAATIGEAESILGGQRIDLMLLDVKLGDDNGIDFLRQLKGGVDEDDGGAARDPDLPVIMISGHASVEDAVNATRLGAFDFLEKPLDRNRVVVTVRNALERRRMLDQVSSLRAAVDSRYELLGTSAVMQELRRQISKVAPTRTRVLITGESGTGKELIARAVHRQSKVCAHEGTFVKVNCAAIAPELIESELFGHVRGAFHGCTRSQARSLFEVAEGGTIFLDEIGDMSTQPPRPRCSEYCRPATLLACRRRGDPCKTNCRVMCRLPTKIYEAAVADSARIREKISSFRLNVVSYPLGAASRSQR